jgi:hypothetical protein
MNEREWTAVTLAFTDLFDKLKKIAPEQINIDKSYVAGKILQDELKRIRATSALENYYITNAGWLSYGIRPTGIRSTGMRNSMDWQKQNEELEKKKEAQRAEELGDLTQALKLSIEKADRDRQGE